MRPIFTLHAGEYLVGMENEKTSKGTRVWMPTKDTGIGLLVTEATCRKSVSIQLKYSQDFADAKPSYLHS